MAVTVIVIDDAVIVRAAAVAAAAAARIIVVVVGIVLRLRVGMALRTIIIVAAALRTFALAVLLRLGLRVGILLTAASAGLVVALLHMRGVAASAFAYLLCAGGHGADSCQRE